MQTMKKFGSGRVEIRTTADGYEFKFIDENDNEIEIAATHKEFNSFVAECAGVSSLHADCARLGVLHLIDT